MLNRELLEKQFDPSQIKQRKGNFGNVLDYIEGHAVIQRLNEAFEGEWSFEILDYKILPDFNQVVVEGKLSTNGVSKTQFGNSGITRSKNDGETVSIGDDLKAAATDALKKAATLLGVGLHLYGLSRTQSTENQSRKTAPETSGNGRITNQQLKAIYSLARRNGMKNKEVNEISLELFKINVEHLNQEQAATVIANLQDNKS